ncbi:MAG: hypothetical protein ACOCQR_02240 [bacterium]
MSEFLDDRINAIEDGLRLLGLKESIKEVKCDNCQGRGKVIYSTHHNSHETDTCSKCKGKGKIDKPTFIFNVKK